MKILFQGDSITDSGRDRTDAGSLGSGYPLFAANMLAKLVPDANFTFFNRGISGNRTGDLLGRLEPDLLDLRPDVVTIMIGINDVWRHFDANDYTPEDVFRKNYESILKRIKGETPAKIVLVEPFYIGNPEPDFRTELYAKIDVVRRLAYQYADKYIPMDGLINSVAIERGVTDFTSDGVHPNENGAKLIAAHFVRVVLELLPVVQKERGGEWKN